MEETKVIDGVAILLILIIGHDNGGMISGMTARICGAQSSLRCSRHRLLGQ